MYNQVNLDYTFGITNKFLDLSSRRVATGCFEYPKIIEQKIIIK